uniref:Uncharacterized protein n=1 Tax=Rhizophora mucronata TaxID=61149 RepID=A0A2P2NX67_RHIMU
MFLCMVYVKLVYYLCQCYPCICFMQIHAVLNESNLKEVNDVNNLSTFEHIV